jgi:hypothetical protein
MSQGYTEITNRLRQGSLSPQQWQAYLKSQQQQRAAFAAAAKTVQEAGAAEGVPSNTPSWQPGMSSEGASERLSNYASNISAQAAYFDIDAQLANYYSTASNNGLTVPKPVMYGKSVKDERTASVILSNYVKLINEASLKKYINDSLSDLKSQAKSNGVSVPDVPQSTIETITSEAGASTLIGNYAALINNKLLQNSVQAAVDSITSQAKAAGVTGVTVPVISSTLSSAQAASLVNDYASRVNNAILYQQVYTTLNSLKSQAVALGANIAVPSLSGLTVDNAQAVIDAYVKKVNDSLSVKAQTQAAALTYRVYDSLGRSYTISAAQFNAMQKAASSSTNSSNTYSVIPEEVANSGTSNNGSSSWWIDSNGEYCWYPQSSSDKAHLAEINKQRTRNGLAALSYLMVGPTKTAEYRAIEEEQAHQYQRDNALTSGEIQLNKLKYSSLINNSASAITNTAQAISNVKILSAAEYAAKYHPSELQLKNGTWVQKVEKKGADTNVGNITQFDSSLTAGELKKLHEEYLKRVSTGVSPATSVYHNDNYEANLKQIAAEVKELEAQRSAFKETVDKNGKIIDAVQVVGSKEASDYTITVFTQDTKTGKIASRSGTANEYQKALNSAKNIAGISITPSTSAADKKVIEAARDYYNIRVTKSVDFSTLDVKKGSQSSFFAAIETDIGKFADALAAISKPGTMGALNAKQLKEIATNNLTLQEDVNSAVGTASNMLIMADAPFTTIPNIMISELQLLNNYVERNVGKNVVNDRINNSLAWVDANGDTAIRSGIVSVTDLAVNSTPLVTLNNYAKTHYGESSLTTGLDLTENVVKALPVSLYEDITQHPFSTAAELSALYAIGAVAGAGYGALKAGEITFIEKAFKDATTLKAALKTGGAAAEGAVQAGMVASIAKDAYDTAKTGNVENIIDFSKAFIFEGKGFAKAAGYLETSVASKYGAAVVESYNPINRLAKIAGQSVGLVRGKTVDFKIDIPRSSQAELIDSVISKDEISGARGTPVHRFVSEASGEPLGIDTFKLPKSLSKLVEARRKQNIQNVGAKYYEFTENQYTLGNSLRKLAGIKQQYLTRFGDTGRVKTPGYAAQVNSQYMVPDVFNGEYEAMGSLFLRKHGKSVLNQEVHLIDNIQTVASELSELQKIQIREQYTTTGRLKPELFQDVLKLAEVKSAKIGQPVAALTPKTSVGYGAPEAEVLLVFGSKTATEITSSKLVGYSPEGVKIKKVRFGTQAEVAKELSILENLRYNWSNITNDRYAKGMSQLINRKIAEENGSAYMRPGQYGPHGTEHTGSVADFMEELWYKSPTLQRQYSLKLVRAAGRLHDAARIYGSSKIGETEPLSHGPAVAKNIRKGRIVDAELNSFTKKEQLELAAAVDTHMWLDPSSKLQYLSYKSSNLQKLLKTADSLARAKDSGYLRKGTTFKLPEERLAYQLKTAVREGVSSLSEGVSRLHDDTVAEFAPHRTKAELKILEAAEKSAENLKSEAIKKEYLSNRENYVSDYINSKYSSMKFKPYDSYGYSDNAKSFSSYLAALYDIKETYGEKTYKLTGKYPPATGKYSQSTGKYSPAGTYSPSTGKYAPQTGKYKPLSGKYTPTGTYSPVTGKYSPSTGKYSPTGTYAPTTGKHTPPRSVYKKIPKNVKVPIAPYLKTPPTTLYGRLSQKDLLIAKKKKEQEAIKQAEKMVRLTRKLQNVLGSLDTILL